MLTKHQILTGNKQQGSALIISLIMLMAMTMIGIAAMTTSTLEEKMAGNSRDRHLSFQAAETALINAEEYISNNIASPSAFDGSNAGLYEQDADPDIHASATWDTALNYTGTAINSITTQPKYIIELVGTTGADDVNISGYGESSGSGKVATFRITVRATGGTNKSVTLLQTNYGRRF